MSKKITAQSVRQTYDDGEHYKRMEKEFKSTVYETLSDYWCDLDGSIKDENYSHTIAGKLTRWSKKRSPEERARLLTLKIEAQRRLDQHHDEGGTELLFDVGGWIAEEGKPQH